MLFRSKSAQNMGGIRGAAQLLARQLPDESLRDYTNVIIEEADRLRNLVDRMLGSNKLPSLAMTNVHEVLERVCSLVEAESQGRITLVRDYDPSIPDVLIDREQMIQAVLNIVRNAMQAISGRAAPGALQPGRAARRARCGRSHGLWPCAHRRGRRLAQAAATQPAGDGARRGTRRRARDADRTALRQWAGVAGPRQRYLKKA